MENNVLSTEHLVGREDEAASRLLKWASAIAAGVVLIALIIVKIFVDNFWKYPLPSEPDSWGQTGDFIGGLVNPVVGLATVLLIFISIHIQRGELRATTRQLDAANTRAAQQNFEQSLFSWLTTHRGLLNAMEADIQLGTKTVSLQGRRLLTSWHARSLSLDVAGIFAFDEPARTAPDRWKTRDKHKILTKNVRAYRTLFQENRSELDAYLRTLYRLFELIDQNEDIESAQRFHYAALVRAQLSWVELAFLFYNGLTDEGSAFIRFYETYAIFDNIKTGKDLLIDEVANGQIVHLGSWEDGPCKPLPYSAACFSSDIARRKNASDRPRIARKFDPNEMGEPSPLSTTTASTPPIDIGPATLFNNHMSDVGNRLGTFCNFLLVVDGGILSLTIGAFLGPSRPMVSSVGLSAIQLGWYLLTAGLVLALSTTFTVLMAQLAVQWKMRKSFSLKPKKLKLHSGPEWLAYAIRTILVLAFAFSVTGIGAVSFGAVEMLKPVI
ncbi:hypothetical protein D3C71_1143790 [compost metagenome]